MWSKDYLKRLPKASGPKNRWRSQQARPEQLMPQVDEVWRTWLFLAGRGTGKTRSVSEAIRELIEVHGYKRIHLIGRTVADVRDVMVRGESGLLNILWEQGNPVYTPSTRRIDWPNGAYAITFSADEPDQLRGPQAEVCWCDEFAAMSDSVVSNAKLGLRLGKNPKMLLSTTPRPTAMVREQAADPYTIVSKGRTSDNAANLAPGFISEVYSKYGGTRLGAQELEGEILSDVAGALWQAKDIAHASLPGHLHPSMVQVAIGVDPAVTFGEESDETGIVVTCLGPDNVAYVEEDLSGRLKPGEWASAVVDAYQKYATRGHYVKIYAESNQGGELIRTNIHTVRADVPVELVRAVGTKAQRAFPVCVLYQRGRVVHSKGLERLEDQMTGWIPDGKGKSPDRMDALVWSMHGFTPYLQAEVAKIANPPTEDERLAAEFEASLERSESHDLAAPWLSDSKLFAAY